MIFAEKGQILPSPPGSFSRIAKGSFAEENAWERVTSKWLITGSTCREALRLNGWQVKVLPSEKTMTKSRSGELLREDHRYPIVFSR